ncbi:MBL fold metallo-hydrolase [Solicola sp. PLA-1-18]|uniref:MBL fold metallo-hydrolase n=1 Tax=Solicola sp. PLA-1-18 TaxID=3380532 RepID=UPI003B78BBC6
MQITRYGHAALLVEAAGTRVLLDPGTFSLDSAFALTGLDAVVITHQHPDHVDVERLPGLVEANQGALLLADPQTVDQLGAAWTATEAGTSWEVGSLSLTGVGERHAVIHPDIPRIGNVGQLVTGENEPVLFHPGDTYEYAPDGVDVLAVPLSAPWAKSSETVEFVRQVAARVVLPIHDCTVSELARPMYWGNVANLGGTDDARFLGQDESTEVTL